MHLINIIHILLNATIIYAYYYYYLLPSLLYYTVDSMNKYKGKKKM